MVEKEIQIANVKKILKELIEVKKVIIDDFYLHHIKEIKVIIIGKSEALEITGNYCTSFCGNLNIWNTNQLELSFDQELIDEKRKFYKTVFAIKDVKNNFFLKFENMSFSKVNLIESKKTDLLTKIDKNPLDEINFKKLLSKYTNKKLTIEAFDNNELTITLKDELIIDFNKPLSKSKGRILKINCLNTTFFCGSFLNNLFISELEIIILEDIYILCDLDNNIKIQCNNIKMREIDR